MRPLLLSLLQLVAVFVFAADEPARQWQYAMFTFSSSTMSSYGTKPASVVMTRNLTFTGPDGGAVGSGSDSGSSAQAVEGAFQANEDFYKRMGWPAEEAKTGSVLTILNRLGKDGWEIVSFEPKSDNKSDNGKDGPTNFETSDVTVLFKRPMTAGPSAATSPEPTLQRR